MCSIDSGPILIFPSGQKLSIDGFVVSNLFPERISLCSTDFFMTPKNEDFHEISTFLENVQGRSRKLLEAFRRS